MRPEKDYVEAAIEVCSLIHANEKPGDILLFLTGEEEIERTCSELMQRVEDDDSLLVLPLYSTLPMAQQKKVFRHAPGKRKVIVATNIAETSLTIDGVVYVVDPGLFKQKLYNPRTHSESLLVSPISRASAMQRAGRAGRTQPGKCFRLYTEETFRTELPESTYPEIIRSNLCAVVLTLKKLGIDDLVHFDFMEPPSPESMMRALEMLHFLGSVDDECDVTEIGRQMTEFALDPHLSRVVIAAAHRGCCSEVIQIVSMLSVPPPFMRPRNAQKSADKAHRAFASGRGDHLSLLAALAKYDVAEDKSKFCWENYLHERALKQAENIVKQLESTVRFVGLRDAVVEKGVSVIDRIQRSFVEGFFMQCAQIDPGGKHYVTMRDQQVADIHPSSFLQHKPEWALYHETVVTDRCYMRNVTSVTAEMLIEVAPKFYHPKVCKFGEHAVRSLERAAKRAKT